MTAAVATPETLAAPVLEAVACLACGSERRAPFVVAEDDLGGRPGRFTFVRCQACDLVYQHPRIPQDQIGPWYDEEYIAHRKRTDWGVLTPLYERAMSRHDRAKDAIVERFVSLRPEDWVLDVGCGSGTFLRAVGDRTGARLAGVDLVDLSSRPEFAPIEFHSGLFHEQDMGADRFRLITLWHYLEHDYDPRRALATARDLLTSDGIFVAEVPRLDSVSHRLYGDRWPGLQAPQHTVLFDKEQLLRMTREAGLEVLEYLPYGAFPAYFYLFCGAAFKLLRGRGLDVQRAMPAYFLGNLLLSPLLLLEKRLNLAMQTVICRRAR